MAVGVLTGHVCTTATARRKRSGQGSYHHSPSAAMCLATRRDCEVGGRACRCGAHCRGKRRYEGRRKGEDLRFSSSPSLCTCADCRTSGFTRLWGAKPYE
jgi:hypothetical protein